ncbi:MULTISPECIES: chemotaxis protein CheB [unclassified Janthinobacterium]|uniref:chemotaxis protein CheB n=1 Tax=unclassified Janthinobacterium TaxID=2610881 RepID=UPI00034920FD|nr:MULTISPECIES: chemotaxis protein CheB [unclassified Janthinobacterium]MEC5161438.1 chemotaxis response regulator CheB [Janthinobacterium sp. CG_S6]
MDALPPREVEDKQALANGTAYFAAPDYHVLFESERSVALSRDQAVNFSRPSIDAAPGIEQIAAGPARLGSPTNNTTGAGAR